MTDVTRFFACPVEFAGDVSADQATCQRGTHDCGHRV